MTRDEARAAVAAASRRLAAEGLLIGTAGNVSTRITSPPGAAGDGAAGDGAGDGPLHAVTATGVVLADATADDVSVVDRDGAVVAGDLAPTSELALHLDLLRRPDVGAVVHTHSPVATALSLVLDEVPVVHYQQLALGGSVPVVPFAVFGSRALATSVATALAHRRAALLANHGTVAIGHDLAAAVEASVLLEWICTLYWRSAALGTPRVLTEGEQRAVTEVTLRTGYGRPRRSGTGPLVP